TGQRKRNEYRLAQRQDRYDQDERCEPNERHQGVGPAECRHWTVRSRAQLLLLLGGAIAILVGPIHRARRLARLLIHDPRSREFLRALSVGAVRFGISFAVILLARLRHGRLLVFVSGSVGG